MNNGTDDTSATESVYTAGIMNLWISLSLICNIIGSLGNALTMVVVAVVKDFHKPNYLLLAGVSVGDFGLNIFHFSFENIQNYMRFFKGQLLGSDTFCIWEAGFLSLFQTGSNISQMLVACNRFMAVFTPIFYRKYFTNRSAIIVWLLASVLFPILFYYGGYKIWIDYRLNRNNGDCDDFPVGNLSYLVINFPTAYIPLSVSLLAYCTIFLRLMLAPGENRKEIMRRSRGSGAMCVCSLIYLLAIFPILINRNTGYTNKQTALYNSLWLRFFYRMTFSVNPVVYFTMDVRMRRGAIILVKKHILRLPGSQQLSINGGGNQDTSGHSASIQPLPQQAVNHEQA